MDIKRRNLFRSTGVSTAVGATLYQVGARAQDDGASRQLQPSDGALAGGIDVTAPPFRARGDGVADDTRALQAAIDVAAVTKQAVHLPPGTYRTSATLRVSASGVRIIGLAQASRGRGSDGGGVTFGATIRYKGKGTAMEVGIAPGRSRDFIHNVLLQDLRIEVDDDTKVALHVWHAYFSSFIGLTIFGNKGAGRIGLWVSAGVANLYDRIEVDGGGQAAGRGEHEYLEKGLFASLGYGNDLITTTVFRNCYFHYCNHGVYLHYILHFEDCVFEANAVGVAFIRDGNASFSRCWWEANRRSDVHLNNAQVIISASSINAYDRQCFLSGGTGAINLTIRDTYFASSHKDPCLVVPDDLLMRRTGNSRCLLSGCTLPKRFRIGGAGYPIAASPGQVVVPEMQRQRFEFITTSLRRGGALDPLRTASGMQEVILPDDGHVLGVELSVSTPIRSRIGVDVRLNGTSVEELSLPPTVLGNETVHSRNLLPYAIPFRRGNALSMRLRTEESSSDAAVSVTILVALGPDGRDLYA